MKSSIFLLLMILLFSACLEKEQEAFDCVYGDCVSGGNTYVSREVCMSDCAASSNNSNNNNNNSNDDDNDDDDNDDSQTECPLGELTYILPYSNNGQYIAGQPICDTYPRLLYGNRTTKDRQCNSPYVGNTSISGGTSGNTEQVAFGNEITISFSYDQYCGSSDQIKEVSYTWTASYEGETHFIDLADLL